MTRKHFIAIAAALSELRANVESADDQDYVTPAEYVDQAARAIAEVCAECNPRFNRARFLSACE